MRMSAALWAVVAGLAASQPAVAAPGASAFPWTAPATTEVVTEERRFMSGGTELSGTLILPASTKP